MSIGLATAWRTFTESVTPANATRGGVQAGGRTFGPAPAGYVPPTRHAPISAVTGQPITFDTQGNRTDIIAQPPVVNAAAPAVPVPLDAVATAALSHPGDVDLNQPARMAARTMPNSSSFYANMRGVAQVPEQTGPGPVYIIIGLVLLYILFRR